MVSHNTGSILGGCSVYGATKCGVLSLTRSMAVEWAKYNIRANCVSPGHIQTALTVPTWGASGTLQVFAGKDRLRQAGISGRYYRGVYHAGIGCIFLYYRGRKSGSTEGVSPEDSRGTTIRSFSCGQGIPCNPDGAAENIKDRGSGFRFLYFYLI